MRKSLIIVACFLLSGASAYAIDAGALGGSIPGVMNKENQFQLKELQIEKKYVETVPQDLDAQKKQDEATPKDVKKGELTYNPQFKLNKIEFEGNTKFSDKKLNALAKDLIGKEVHLEDVMDFTVQVSRFYQKHGYLTSYAYLSPQEIKDGIVIVNVKESKVVEKNVAGQRWEKEWFLKNIALGGKGLRTNNVFNSKDLQGDMKVMNRDTAYLKGSAEISKNKNDDTIIKLNVADRFPIRLSLGWDDFGRNYTGRQRFTSMLGIDNLTGFGDKIYGGAILSTDAKGAVAGYQIPINKYGTKLAFDYSYSNINLGGPYRSLNINGTASDYAVRLTHPLISTATKELMASISVDAVNSKSDAQALNYNIADYSLRVLRTGLYGMFDDKKGRTIASFGVDMGTDALGASKGIDNGPQSVFYKVIASVARIQRLPKNCLGIVRLNGQYSPQSLYASEQMYLGGAYSLRGYQPSELLGDYGVSGSFEIRTPVPGLQKILPKKVKSWSDKVKLAAFYDWGYVQEYNQVYNYPQQFLHSFGFGTYVNLTDAIYVQMGLGIPIGPKYYNDDSARWYFSVNTDIDKIFLKPRERL